MRYLIILSCAIHVIYGNFETDLHFIKICNETSPISLRVMNEVLINKKLTDSKLSINFKCFLHCLYTHYGWMDDEGGFELHEMKFVLKESGSIDLGLLDFILYTCTAIKSVDKCERAFKFTQCFWHKTAQEEANDADRYFYSIDK